MADAEEFDFETRYGYEHISRETTSLYTFIGSSMLGDHHIYDHIVNVEYEDDDPDGRVESFAYFFKIKPASGEANEDYDELAKHIRQHNFPQHINLTKPYPVDVQAFEALAGIDTDDLSHPEDWDGPLDGRGME